ncbi:DNA polymerase kappa [Penicillium digitatum]|uniref:DNA polymerase kappa n=1 Tax=Penicillium digitatum TaxID=36651 RepID=A0A7T6XM04_PENDI|nr:DNA polymerase kappa [Penicillium digitatum]
MTYDKQNTGSLAKPFTPTLSATFHRSNKAPLTPKLASPNPGPGSGPGLPRRLAHSDHPYSTPSKDDSPAVPTFLSANITPRSGPRTTRRDGAFYSPTNISHAPSPSPHAPYSQSTIGYGRRDRSPARGIKPEQSRSMRAKTLTAENQPLSRPDSFSDMTSGTPLFFYASDARSSHPSEPPDAPRPRAQGKISPASSFIYANGDQERNSPGEQSNGTSTSAKRRSSDVASHPPDDLRLPYIVSAENGLGIPPRFGSPSSSLIDEKPRLQPIRHTKSSSVDSGLHGNYSQESLRASPFILSGSYVAEGTASVMSEQIITLRPRILSNVSTTSTDTYPSAPLSPGKSDGPSEAALNARTERKIMDLEISNSSLLAINRTLEREMRQQKAELRRFRRLSRSGRISMAPSTRSSGAALSVTSELDEGGSEIPNQSQDDMSDISDEDSTADESISSPGSLVEHDSKHRVSDEKHVMLDLARHQEVLVDSQRMNRSLKRCLGWTEELIKEGQRALEYNVHVQDVELGGRVLAPEELGEVAESGRGLLSSSTDYNAVFSPVEAYELSSVESPSIGTLSPTPSISADPST